MYGLINSALVDFMRTHLGESSMEAALQKCGCEHVVFATMETFPDEYTYRMVGEHIEQTGRPAQEVLEQFGEYWLLEVAAKRFNYLLSMVGNDFFTCIENLDLMHERIATEFDNLKQPSFQISKLDDGSDSYEVIYVSHRVGLEYFVMGLLRGLVKYHQISASIDLLNVERDSGTKAKFLIKIKA
ncbi:MAG: hypothetical protein JW384_01001 [Nitrosomonadaceae bacterium]|nr:hypothetical protein [Nitrosomonadaceae bacterium]